LETVAKIRRAHFVQGKGIKAICRELHVSRKVVRKVLKLKLTRFGGAPQAFAGGFPDAQNPSAVFS
jgi:hypothetical protein